MAWLWSLREVIRARVVVVAIVVITLMGCGDGDARATSSTDEQSDLSVAAQEFGQAYLSGDSAALLDLIEPGRSEQIREEYRELVESYGRPSGVVELRDFGFEITREDELEGEVSYSGQVCQETLTNEFPETTIGGDADTNSSTVNTGSTVVGEVKCADIREAAPLFWQVGFVKVDGHWYGKLPGT